jgi:hypothetical protein
MGRPSRPNARARRAAREDRRLREVLVDIVSDALPDSLQPVGALLRYPQHYGASGLTGYGEMIVEPVVDALAAAFGASAILTALAPVMARRIGADAGPLPLPPDPPAPPHRGPLLMAEQGHMEPAP